MKPTPGVRSIAPEHTGIEYMINGGARKHRLVIFPSGDLKWWLGMAWVNCRKATPQDYKRYPKVRRQR